jgi:hypothetical protein
MTDMQNSLIPEKSNLKSSYMKSSQKSHIEEDNSLIPSAKKEEITIISGIGPKVADKLNNIGVFTVYQLAESSPQRIANINGIGLITAQKYVSRAKEHMRIKKLNDFSEEEQNTIQVSEVISEPSPSEGVNLEFEYEEIDEQVNEKESIREDEDELDEDFSVNEEEIEVNKTELRDFEVGEFKPPETIKPDIPPQSPPTPEVVITPEILRQSNLVIEKRQFDNQEFLPTSQVKNSLNQLSKELNLSDFNLVQRTPQLRSIFTGIDLLAIKHVRVKEFMDLIYIIPIKMSSLKGSLIVSNENITYRPSKDTQEISNRTRLTPRSYMKALSQAKESIYADIVNDGILFQYLSKYLGIHITLERSLTRKSLFFRSGPLQYKILIEPVLVNKNTVGFTEKILPFAYQKSTNIHIVAQSKFGDLMQYLDQKYFLLENYSEQTNALTVDSEATNKFMKDLRNYSAPFMFFGIILLLVLLSQAYFVLPLLVNLGFGVVSIYIVMVGYLYLKLYQKKSELHQEFSTPYYQKKLNLDQSTLILINEEISPKLMDQFIFECVGKNANNSFINKREAKNAEELLTERAQTKKVEQSNIFESEIYSEQEFPEQFGEVIDEPPSKDSDLKRKMVDKYSSFLEDD